MIQDLALILIVAAVVTLVFKRLRQPLVLGYIVAGFLVSPHMPYVMSVASKQNVQEWADIGVMFLLFSLGLDFSFKKIVKMGAAPIIAAVTIVLSMMMTGYSVGTLFGWGHIDCVFLGGMLAMSSTTIIYKAYDDLGLRQQRFAQLVMSVLILEDILAIVLMVMLSAVATGDSPDGGQMLMSVLRLGFFLVLWFVVGIFALPLLLRKARRLMTAETLLVTALGLCCMMAVVSAKAGFSPAFGAFVMGSILAETVEAEKIERVTEPVKNLFGAVFFVSVGMLVEPQVLVEYALPIAAIVFAILAGQMLFGTLGFFLSGQTLHTAMRCGFSMAQIGEFAFIIASLGMSLHVIAPYLYPVVVAVSVITTFLTPYMIRGAEPAYRMAERHLPHSFLIWLDSLTTRSVAHGTALYDAGKDSCPPCSPRQLWHRLLRSMALNTVVYTIILIAVTYVMLTVVLLLMRTALPHWWANGVTGVLTVVALAPFMRAIVMKKNHSPEWRELWGLSPLHRLPLLFTVVARAAICLAFLFYVCNYLARFADALVITLGVCLILVMVLSRSIKRRSIGLERLFLQNLRSREAQARVSGARLPSYAGRLVERDLNIAEVVVPENSTWAGQTLAELRLRERFAVHVSSILRSGRRQNIPYGTERIFPADRLQVIGTDEQIATLCRAAASDVLPDDERDPSSRETIMRQVTLPRRSPLVGKALRDSRLREDYGLLVVGMEQGQPNLTAVNPAHTFQPGDILWFVGERSAFARFEGA